MGDAGKARYARNAKRRTSRIQLGVVATGLALGMVACGQSTDGDGTAESGGKRAGKAAAQRSEDIGTRADTPGDNGGGGGVDQGSRSSKKRPVILVHGLKGSPPWTGHNCGAYWGKTNDLLKASGWDKGQITTWGWLKGNDKKCELNTGSMDMDTHPDVVSRKLANYIYDKYSKHGKTVDVVGHSMGGLILRNAIVQTNKGKEGFPPYLRVEDAVTVASPHYGSQLGRACVWLKMCYSVLPSNWAHKNEWIDKLNDGGNAEAKGGTDWTLIGSDSDDLVNKQSAMADGSDDRTRMRAEHRIRYNVRDVTMSHQDLLKKGDTGGNWRFRREDTRVNGGDPYWVDHGGGPVRMIKRAVQYGRW